MVWGGAVHADEVGLHVVDELVQAQCRSNGVTWFAGVGARTPREVASLARQCGGAEPLIRDAGLGTEFDATNSSLDSDVPFHWDVRPFGLGSGAIDHGVLQAQGGAGLGLRAYWGSWEGTLVPNMVVDIAPENRSLSAAMEDLWLGWEGSVFGAGVGMRDRRFGPGRRGTLVVSDHAMPVPHGQINADWTLPRAFGRLHMEGGVGVLTGERSDVAYPGWLFMDARWLSAARSERAWVPVVEFGATRASLFGGVGRPSPSIGQLLVPTDPHVYDDPEQLEPDQDEIAALDLRLSLPLPATSLDYVEVWWQYGGEDVIARKIVGIPAPALAGVANLAGLEIGASPWTLTAEHARILDDYFRWYTGHRVYHEGFVHEGQVMGHAYGGDAVGWWLQLRRLGDRWGVAGEAEEIRRVGIIAAADQNLFALSDDELRRSVAMQGWLRDSKGTGWWTARISIAKTTGVDFVLGQDCWSGQLTVGR